MDEQAGQQAGQIAYEANIESLPNGTVCAEIAELPGCYAMANDAAAATYALDARIPAYFEWLRSHDEYTPIVRGPFRSVAKETQRSAGQAFGVAFFATDAEPVSTEDLDFLTALLEWSLDDALRLAERIAPATLDISTRFGASPHWLLETLVLAQAKLLDKLNANPDPDAIRLSDAPLLTQLREARDVSLRRLRSVSEADRRRIFEVQGTRWSLRKILRCGILAARMTAEGLASVVSA